VLSLTRNVGRAERKWRDSPLKFREADRNRRVTEV